MTQYERQLPEHVRIEETVDGTYMVLVSGFQWGFIFDRSGAGNAVYPTREAAARAWLTRYNDDCDRGL